MEALIVQAVYIAFGLVAIGMGGYLALFPDRTKQFMKDQQPDQWSKDRIEKSGSGFGLWIAGCGFVVFGAALIFKALTSA